MSAMIKALGKVIVAAAWADGEISNEEINNLKDLLFHMPGMTASDWHELQIYVATPVGDEERERLVDELQHTIATPKQKKLALEAIDKMVATDSTITPEEEAILNEVRGAIENTSVGVVGALGKLLTGPMSRRANATAPNREQSLDDFVRNRVYYGVRQMITDSDEELDLPDDLLRKLSLAGGMMAQIAHADKEIHQAEIDTMTEALVEGWHVEPQQAAIIATVAASDIAADMDAFRLSREFFEVCTRDELIDFMKVLFRVAAADGLATAREISEIRTISTHLLLTNQEFIEAKLSIPREKRAE